MRNGQVTMLRNLSILVLAALVIALPFIFRKPAEQSDWKPGDPELVVITPMNEAIRYEFGRGFSAWHRHNYGRPVRMDWRAIGGTTEIMRYVSSELVNAARAWWTGQGNPWPAGAGEALIARTLDTNKPAVIQKLYQAFRQTDDPKQFTSKLDLLWGGGVYDHNDAYRQGLTVAPWPPGREPTKWFVAPDGTALIPESMSGEIWRTPWLFGNVLSTFGICYNVDRIRDLGITHPPQRWDDLADPAYFRQVAVADPTKSGSIAKAFEMIIQQKCREAVLAAGFSDRDIQEFEALFQKSPSGERPGGVPAKYQEAIEAGWRDGLKLIQLIGANARYFTDAATKIVIDVGMGDAAAGLAIDFYGRYQAQCSRAPDGHERMVYVTPVGGSSVSADPVSLLRGAEHRDIAMRFIQFLVSEEGQKLWTYRPGTPGGPERFALRRIPIRRDFYPSDDPQLNAVHLEHVKYAADNLADPAVNPYALATNFTYQARWTAPLFGFHRTLIKSMCIDSGDELRQVWGAVIAKGGPAVNPAAVNQLCRLPDRPEPLTWSNAANVLKKYGEMKCAREWTEFYRENYRKVREELAR